MSRDDFQAESVPQSPFECFDMSDVQALIARYPLAWVCAPARDRSEASLLPLIGVYDGDGALEELIGHVPRSHPVFAALEDDPRALILFNGPQGYVSPEHAGRRDWAPTWNFAQLTIHAEMCFDASQTEQALNVLIDAVEAERAEPWSSTEIGPRYHGMLERIIGFRARVTGVSGRFKLGQDEHPDTLRSILASHPDPGLVEWMRRMNKGRG